MDLLFDGLVLIWGLCLFLFGMSLMGSALERCAGGRLERMLGKLTTGRIAGLLTGLGVTAIIQSSSATTVMVVGFANSGLMSLRQAIHVIMGANIGTTVTAWILSLGGISGDSLFLKLLKPTSFTPVLALVGIILFMFAKSNKKKDVGTIILSFAVLMFGMDAMTGAVSGLSEVEAFKQLFIAFENPILGVLAGAVLTAIIQSSSASVGILQALTVTGAVTYGSAIPIIMGQNIGTCITAILSSFGTNKNARRAALVHLSFNIIGTLVWLPVFFAVDKIFDPALFSDTATQAGIAIAHSLFNLACTMLLLPMAGLLERLAYKVIPEGAAPEKTTRLDERLLATPAVALERCRDLTAQMAAKVKVAITDAIACVDGYEAERAARVRQTEEESDGYEDDIGTFLVKLSSAQLNSEEAALASMLLKAIGDLERISDHAVNIVEGVEELREKGISFTDEAKPELSSLCAACTEIVDTSFSSFAESDCARASTVEPLEQVIDRLKEILRARHIDRLRSGSCSIEAGFVWSDLITDMERVGDHCSNLAACVIDSVRGDLSLHESLKAMRRDREDYGRLLDEYTEKYMNFLLEASEPLK